MAVLEQALALPVQVKNPHSTCSGQKYNQFFLSIKLLGLLGTAEEGTQSLWQETQLSMCVFQYYFSALVGVLLAQEIIK